MAGAYRELKKLHYLKLIKECAQSGKDNRTWCSENGIAYSSFMRWQAQLRDEAAERVSRRGIVGENSDPKGRAIRSTAEHAVRSICSGNCERTHLMVNFIGSAHLPPKEEKACCRLA